MVGCGYTVNRTKEYYIMASYRLTVEVDTDDLGFVVEHIEALGAVVTLTQSYDDED